MVFLRYLTCIVAAIAVIFYTVHLERNTPVVLNVKTMLGLDTTNLQAARNNRNDPDQAGVMTAAFALLQGGQGLPSLSDLMSTSSKPKQSEHLPEALSGWMREDAEIDVQAVMRFEESFFPGRKSENSQVAAAIEDATGQDYSGFASDHLKRGGLKMTGAFYYRENMRMLITISSLPKSMGWAANQMMNVSNLATLEHSNDPSRVMEWGGDMLPVNRDKKTGYGQVSVMAGEDFMVQIRGNVPTNVMKSYLETITLVTPANSKPEPSPEFSGFLSGIPSDWSGSPRLVSYDEILDFDAEFAPGGVRRDPSAADLTLLANLEREGMLILGDVFRKDDARVLLTVTELPSGTVSVDGARLPIALAGPGLLELTRSFGTTNIGRVTLGTEGVALSGLDETGYVNMGRMIGGAYLVHARGRATEADIQNLLDGLNYEDIKTAAVALNPEWK